MLTIKTKIGPSSISGMGLFADQAVEKGAMVWKLMPNFDLIVKSEEIDKLSESAREQFHNYAYLDKALGAYVLCSDDAPFFNHSKDPNCDDRSSEITYALKDIAKGEEVTVNYLDFYGDIADHPEVL